MFEYCLGTHARNARLLAALLSLTVAVIGARAQTTPTLLRVAQSGDNTTFDSNVVGVIKAYPTNLTAQAFYAYGTPAVRSFNGGVSLTSDRIHLFFVDASDGLAAFGVYDSPDSTDGGNVQLTRNIRPKPALIDSINEVDRESNYCLWRNTFTNSYGRYQRQQWGAGETDGWIDRLDRAALTEFRVTLSASPNAYCSGAEPLCGDGRLYSGLTSMAALSSNNSVTSLGLDQRTVQFRIIASCALTVWPSQQSVCAGSTIKLSARPNATGTATFAWFKGATPITAATPRATIVTSADGLESTLTITGATAADAGSYTCTTTSSCGVQSSSPLSVIVTGGTPTVTNPVSRSTTCDGTATMSVTAGGNGPFTYQWFRDGEIVYDKSGNLTGSDTSALSITSAIPAHAGMYTCRVSNACGSVLSGAASLTVSGQTVAITQSPASVNICPGSTVTLNGAASGDGPITYRWTRLKASAGGSDWVGLNDGADPDLGTISGSNTQSLTLTGINTRAAGLYRLKVSNACGCDYSASATLTASCRNIADIVALGGVRGCDGQITNDDIVAFLAGFFAQTTVGDVATIGGAIFADGEWTADDIIAFLAAFFRGCP